MVFPLLTPGPALSLSPLVLLVPRSRLDFLFLHVGFSLHQEESSSFPLFPFAPSIIVSHSLSPSLCISPTRSRGLSHRATDRHVLSLPRILRSAVSLYRSPLPPIISLPLSLSLPPLIPTAGTRWTCVSLGSTSPGILSSFPPWSKLLPAAVAAVGQRGDRLGGGRLAGEDHGCTFSRPRSPQPRDARNTPISWRYCRSTTDIERFFVTIFCFWLNGV